MEEQRKEEAKEQQQRKPTVHSQERRGGKTMEAKEIMNVKKGLKQVLVFVMILTMTANLFGLVVSAEPEAEYNTLYLSDMNWESVSVGYGSPMKDFGQENLPLRLQQSDSTVKTYAKGLMLHAASQVVYNLEGLGAERFRTDIGINYTKAGSCGFYVYADGVQLYGNTRLNQGPCVSLDLELPENTKELKLVTTDGGNGNANDHSVWADARLMLDASYQAEMTALDFAISSAILKQGETAQATLTATLKNLTQVVLTKDNAQVAFTSDDESVATIDENGVITAISDGSSLIRCTVTYQGVTMSSSSFVLVSETGGENAWTAQSPEGSVQVGFTLNENGELSYMATKDGKTVVEPSPTGLVTSLGDFTKGLIFRDAKTVNGIEDNYELIGAKVSQVETVYNELTMRFFRGNAAYSIVVRLYDDGFGFRYVIGAADGSTQPLRITTEKTGLQMPEVSAVFTSRYNPQHEVKMENRVNNLNETFTMPLTYQTASGVWAMVSEAALSPAYCGAAIKGNTGGMLNIIMAPEQSTAVETTTNFESPWRFVVMGDLNTIVENTMPENLSPPRDETLFPDGDVSWIEPGVTAWTWLNDEGTRDPAIYRRYIDLAQEMGWKYVLMDEPWQPSSSTPGRRYEGYYAWVDELIQYAADRGIRMLGWGHVNDLNTPEKYAQLAEWSEKGIAGIKADFFDSQEQRIMKLYDELMKMGAQHQLLVNFHGANKPTGERRTYPNVLAREGVYGAEQRGGVTSYHNLILPFTRGALGSNDYTPMITQRVNSDNTTAAMAAMSIVYECGIPCFSDRDVNYRNSPAKALVKDIPVSWDETTLLDGYPGEYVNIARRAGSEWYVGMISQTARTTTLKLDFLQEGQSYYAYIYKDGQTAQNIDVEMKMVTKGDELVIPMMAKGGASVKLSTVAPSEPDHIAVDYSSLTIGQHKSATLAATVTPEGTDLGQVVWSSSNPAVATVNNGVVKGISGGRAVITASAGFNGRVKATCEVTVLPNYHTIAGDWEVFRPDNANWWVLSEESMVINTQYGELYGRNTGTNDPKNIVLTDVKDQDFTLTVQLDFQPGANYESAGLIVYQDDENYFGAWKRYHTGLGNNVFTANNEANTSANERGVSDSRPNDTAYLKITKVGNAFTAYYSYDNSTWTTVQSYNNTVLGGSSTLRVGLYAASGNGSGIRPATFTNFTYTGMDGVAQQIPFGKLSIPTAETTLPETIVQNEVFQFTVKTEKNYKKLTLYNENMGKMGISILNKTVNEDGSVTTQLAMSVGTPGEGRVFSIYDGEILLGQFGFDVIQEEKRIISLEAPESVVQNEIFEITLTVQRDIKRPVLYNDVGRKMGIAIVSKTDNGNGTVTFVLQMSIGTAGTGRQFFVYENDIEYGGFMLDVTKA